MDDLVSRTRDGRALRAWESRTARPLALAALAFVLVLTLPVVDPHLTGAAKLAVDAADLTIWLVFLGDYLVRLSLAPSRWRFVRTHLPDLALVALPALRPLRILRLLSLGNLIARRSVRNLVADTSLVVPPPRPWSSTSVPLRSWTPSGRRRTPTSPASATRSGGPARPSPRSGTATATRSRRPAGWWLSS